jgi:hypothetical protein
VPGWTLSPRLPPMVGVALLDVPAKLSARARMFSTGHGRKTDATDAHAIAVGAVRTPNLSSVAVDGELVALRLLADRRDELAGARCPTSSAAPGSTTSTWLGVAAVTSYRVGMTTWCTAAAESAAGVPHRPG